MDYIEILKLVVGYAIGTGVLFACAYFYQAWKSEYLRHEYLRDEAEREGHDDN